MIAIDREKVLEIFKDIHPLDYNAAAYREQIKALPIFNFPEAEWIDRKNNAYACSNCLNIFGAPDNYCRECGAKMVNANEF